MKFGIFREDAELLAPLWLKSCALLSLLSTAALYVSLPIQHSMALRNILLLLSFISGIVLISRSGTFRVIIFSRPIALLMLLLGWVTFHAAFLSGNGGDAWEELWGQWYKPYMAMVGGLGCALCASYMRKVVFDGLLVGVLLALPLWFVVHSLVYFKNTGWVLNPATISGLFYQNTIFAHKLAFLPFVEIMAAFSFYRLLVYNKVGAKLAFLIWLIPVAISYYIALITDTKNSLFLLSLMSGVLIVLVFYRRAPRSVSWLHMGLAIIMVIVAVGGIYGSLKTSSQWASVSYDAKVAFDIDGIRNWENRDKYGLPRNTQNEEVSESTYLRIAYAVAGVREIAQHPLGYGVTRHAFERLVQQRNPEAKIANSHSGYIDLVASVGIPALILLLAAEIALIKQAYKSIQEHSYMIWILGMIMLHWVVDPLSRDQHVYALFLLMGYFSITVAQQKGAESFGNLRDR